jgi:hypothetical protein
MDMDLKLVDATRHRVKLPHGWYKKQSKNCMAIFSMPSVEFMRNWKSLRDIDITDNGT